MDGSQQVYTEITLVESSGWFGTAGQPTLLCWFHHCSGKDDGKVTVLARARAGHGWVEFTRMTTLAEAREVESLLARAGVPGRTPAASGRPDTCDVWTHLNFCAHCGDRGATTLDIYSQCSGFDGADAEPLRRLFRYLFSLAGFTGYSSSLYEEPYHERPGGGGGWNP